MSTVKVWLGVLLVIVAGVLPAAAAEKPDVSAGYQFQRLSGGGDSENVPMGFNVDVAFPIAKDLGVVGQVDWSRKSTSVTSGGASVDATENFTFFGGGVRWSSHSNPSMTPFVHVLGGAARSSGGGSINGQSVGSISETDGMVQFGGGVSVPITPKVNGVGQVDYRRVFSPDQGTNSIRVVVGVRFNMQ